MRPNAHEIETMHFAVFYRVFHRKLPWLLKRAVPVRDAPRAARVAGSIGWWLSFFALLSLSACGYVGNPLAPTLELPQRVTDLQAVEYGDHIRIEFTIAPETTEGLPLQSLRSLDLRVGTAPEPWSESAWAAAAKRIPCTAGGAGRVACSAPAAEWIGKEVITMVRATGPKGKTSDWSPINQLPVQPPLTTPTELNIRSVPAGLYFAWKSPAKKFRVFLQTGDDPPQPLGFPTDPNWLQTDNIEFGVSYRFYVQAVVGELQQSEIAESQPLLRADTFIPTVPAGLIAEQGANAIQLSWQRNTDARFQGYNVYRSVDGATLEKIASLIIAPAFSDTKVEAGKKYLYRVTAVGTNGLESEQSAPAEITAQ
jgi:hypothetical protein